MIKIEMRNPRRRRVATGRVKLGPSRTQRYPTLRTEPKAKQTAQAKDPTRCDLDALDPQFSKQPILSRGFKNNIPYIAPYTLSSNQARYENKPRKDSCRTLQLYLDSIPSKA